MIWIGYYRLLRREERSTDGDVRVRPGEVFIRSFVEDLLATVRTCQPPAAAAATIAAPSRIFAAVSRGQLLSMSLQGIRT